MRRVAVVAGALLLIWGLAIQAPYAGRGPVAAQDDEATLKPFPTVGEFATVNPDAWPTFGEFQTPGLISTANAIATANALATLAPEPTAVPEPGTIRVVPGRGASASALAADVAVELILDTSGSMLQPLGDERRIDVAKAVLTELVHETLPPDTPLALRVFGDEPDSCETQPGRRPAAARPGAAVAAEIAAIEAVDGVKTPIGAALEQVAADLAAVDGTEDRRPRHRRRGDLRRRPRSAPSSALVDQGIDVRVNIVGFAVDDEALKAQFQEWARLGGGQYFDAADAEELGAAIARRCSRRSASSTPAGDVVAQRHRRRRPVPVPAGTYTVLVLSEPEITIDDVLVGDSDDVRLSLIDYI